MKFITVRDLRTSPAQVWKQLPAEKEMIITNNGRPIALLTPISDEDLEETLKSIRAARATAAVKKLQLGSVRKGKDRLTDVEIQREIQETRNRRRK